MVEMQHNIEEDSVYMGVKENQNLNMLNVVMKPLVCFFSDAASASLSRPLMKPLV